MTGRFTNPSASDISSGLMPVPPPIKKSDVTAVRTNYGIAADFKPKGQSDTSLYNHSVKFVLDWWKRSQAPATGAGTPPSGATGGGSSGGGAGGGGATGSGGATMPDTATGTGGPAGGLAHIQTAQEAQAQALGTQRGAQIAAKATPVTLPAVPNKPITNPAIGIYGTVSKSTAQSILTQMGVKGVTPPSSALTSATALRAWANQQLAKQKQAQALAQSKGAATAKKAGV